MKTKLVTLIFTLLILSGGALGQTSWLDKPLRNWNTSSNVPSAPRSSGDNPSVLRCRDTVRVPESIADRAVTRAGWSLFGAAQIFGGVALINAMASVDGMCRPNQYNTFIFVNNRFAGALSPNGMDSRTDGALVEAKLHDLTNISAEFARYTSNDALCCPSQTSSVAFQINGSRVEAQTVRTSISCPGEIEEPPDPNVVNGNVTYDQLIALPRNAMLIVRLVDVSRQNAPSKLVTEQRIDLNGRQGPIAFSIKFEEKDIIFRNDYAIEAEILSGSRTLYKSDGANRVLTKGNPTKIEIMVNPVGGQKTDSILRGTVNYRERIALGNDSEIKVKLVDVSSLNDPGTVIAEESFLSNGRQVPLSFEVGFNRNQINPRRRYVVRAEIFSGGKLLFTTDTEYVVLTQGAPSSNIAMTLVAVKTDELPVITGKDISISKFGTGSLSIEGRSDELIIRGSVKVQTDGNAEVSVSPIGSGLTLTGNLTYFDNNTLRITVTKSGSADASGEIEVKYNGRRLNSINSKELVVDGQKASISF